MNDSKQGISRRVSSSQSGIHPRLHSVLSRYQQHPDQKPVAAHTLEAFDQLQRVCDLDQALILDSGCGTGESTRILSTRYPDHMVLGVDQSENRLARAGLEVNRVISIQDNCVFLRAELMDLCRLMSKAGIRFSKHFALYPNPWPKPGHLQRRYHAHPAFRDMLSLSPRLEVRTNWFIYAEECAASLQYITGTKPELAVIDTSEPLTAFERKYSDSGHELYRLSADGLTLNL